MLACILMRSTHVLLSFLNFVILEISYFDNSIIVGGLTVATEFSLQQEQNADMICNWKSVHRAREL